MPAAVICTEEFVASAKAQAAICGNPLYEFAVVAHPIGSLTLAELQGAGGGRVAPGDRDSHGRGVSAGSSQTSCSRPQP